MSNRLGENEELFRNEQEMIMEATCLLASPSVCDDPTWREHYDRLLSMYKTLAGHTVKLTNIGDLMQENLGRLNEQMKEANALQAQLLATAATAIFTVNEDQRITRVSEAFCSVSGFEREEIIGEKYTVILTQPGKEIAAILAFDAGDPVFGRQCVVRTRDGRSLSTLMNVARLTNGEDRTVGAIVSFVDVTELIEARLRAEAADRAKSRFLAGVSHEIRTPMNVILGMTGLVLDSETSPRQRELLGMVKKSADHLLKLIDDILDLSKVEAEKLELEEIPFHFREFIRDTVALLSHQAQSKNMRLDVSISPDIPPYVTADPLRLRQVLVNLVGNAIKFTEAGQTISLRVEPRGPAPDAADGGTELQVLFIVRDPGIGIPREQQERIFQAFSQVDRSYARKYGGAGLGLTISRHLVWLMRGEIQVESEPGKGSVFSFFVTLRAASGEEAGMCESGEESPPTEEAKSPERLRILVAEDCPANRVLVAELLTSGGHQVVTAENGLEALRLLGAERFDMVLMDVEMPGLDGLETTARIRREAPNGASIPVIALTAHIFTNDREKCLAAGMNDFITKPVSAAGLFATIARHSGRGEAKDNRERREPPQRARPKSAVTDFGHALELLDGNRGILENTCRVMATVFPRRLREMGEALASGNAEILARLAHSTKSALEGIGAGDVARVARELEAVGRKKDLESAKQLFPELERGLQAVLEEIDEYLRKSRV